MIDYKRINIKEASFLFILFTIGKFRVLHYRQKNLKQNVKYNVKKTYKKLTTSLFSII